MKDVPMESSPIGTRAPELDARAIRDAVLEALAEEKRSPREQLAHALHRQPSSDGLVAVPTRALEDVLYRSEVMVAGDSPVATASGALRQRAAELREQADGLVALAARCEGASDDVLPAIRHLLYPR